MAWYLRGHLLAEFRQRVQNRLGDILDDVKLTELVWNVRPQLLEYLRVKRRTIRGDATHQKAAFVQLPFELAQESADVVVSRIVLENSERQAVILAVVHDREDAEGPIVDLVDG